MAHDHHKDADDGAVHVHVHDASLYYKVFGALIFFTLLTVAVAEVHLGAWNFLVAVVIATMKAALVAAYFMHLKDDNRFNVLLFIGSILFMGVFFVYTMNDTEHRGEFDQAYGTKVLEATGEVAPGGCAIAACRSHEGLGGHGGEHGAPAAPGAEHAEAERH
jgi:cytochrome c oxidase subunit 4